MKRLLVFFAVLASLSLFIAGCGGSSGKSSSTPGPDEQKKMAEQMQKRFQEGKAATGAVTEGTMPGGPAKP